MIKSTRTVREFLDEDYKSYAKYVLEHRAIPSYIDGFKPSQRKIAYAANKLWKTGNEKPLKVFQLGGQAAAMSFFHHGSLDQTIIGMAQDFKNSMPIFKGVGQFGSLRSPEAGAPRYVGVKFNDNFRLLYKDFDLCTPKYEEGEEIEPHFFLPIIPTVLLNGGSGIAVGFASNILNRDPLSLIDACIAVLDGGKPGSLQPWIKGFKGSFEVPEDNPKGWIISGCYEVKNSTTVEITEIPPSFTYERYEQLLDNLEKKGTITSYEDHSAESVRYVVKFTRQKLEELQSRDKLSSTLKMQERDSENFTTLDQHGKLKIFNSAEEIVESFVSFRLTYFTLRKDRILRELEAELAALSAKAQFIKAIIDNRVVVSNVKKAEVIRQMEQQLIPKIEDSYDPLLAMQIHTLTQEKYQELLAKIAAKTKEQIRVQKKTPEEMYMEDLFELRLQLTNSNKQEASK